MSNYTSSNIATETMTAQPDKNDIGIFLTEEEAYALLTMALTSVQDPTPLSNSVIKKLTRHLILLSEEKPPETVS